jgi:helix-turn-helix protein
VNLVDRLRALAEQLPPGASLTLTRDGLLGLATEHDDPDQPPGRPDFTIAELATRFYRSPSTIRGWCEHGRFEGAYKLNGRDWRIPPAGVDGFLDEQRGERAVSPLGLWRVVGRADMARR